MSMIDASVDMMGKEMLMRETSLLFLEVQTLSLEGLRVTKNLTI